MSCCDAFSRTCIFFLLALSFGSFSSLIFFVLLFSFLLFLFSSLLVSSLLFSDSSHLFFSSAHIVGSLTARLPSNILHSCSSKVLKFASLPLGSKPAMIHGPAEPHQWNIRKETLSECVWHHGGDWCGGDCQGTGRQPATPVLADDAAWRGCMAFRASSDRALHLFPNSIS